MKAYPLIKFVLLFICGIIFQKVFNWDLQQSLFVLAFLIVISIPIFFIKKTRLKHTLLNIVLSLAIVIVGIAYLAASELKQVSYPFEKMKNTNSVLFGKITDIELKREGQIIFTAEVDSVVIENTLKPIAIIVLCKVYDDNIQIMNEYYNELGIGNEIMLKGTIQKGREKRNPGEFDYYKYLKSEGVSAICNSYSWRDLYILNDKTDFVYNTLFKIRKAIDDQIHRLHTKEAASLIRGLLLADRSEIDYDLRESFVNAGVVHVLAVSGLHVGFIILIFLFLFGRLNIYLRYILTITGIILFLIITGSPPSVFRSSIMAVTLIIAFLTNRSYNSINSLALAAFILLLLNPNELFNPGFQLSFSAVLSIVLIYPLFSDKIYGMKLESKMIQYILLFFSVSMAAQIGTLPFTLIYFHKLSIVALFANLLVIPMIGMIVGISIFTLVVGSLWTWLGLVYGSATNFLVEILFGFVDVAGSSGISHIYINQFSLIDTLIFYLAISITIYLIQLFVSLRAKILLLILMVMNLFVYIALDNYKILEDGKLSVLTIDVAQGDAIFLKFPDGTTALIDAGDRTEYFDNGSRTIAPLLKYLGEDKINYGFITHFDSDHYGGYISLLEMGIIERLFIPPVDSTNPQSVQIMELGIENNIISQNYKKEFIEIGNSRIYVLNTASSELYNSFDSNDKSGILKVVYGNCSFLFVGDAGHKAENLLVETYNHFLDSDVLKVGHHGSKNSSSDNFLKTVNPEIAIISAGIQNKFNHPSQVVIEKLKNMNVKISRTDYQGAILYMSDGESIREVNWRLNDSNKLSNY